MKDAARAKWLAGFDMEPLVASILLGGVLVSSGLVVIGLALHRMATGQWMFDGSFQGSNLLQFMLADLRQIVSGRIGTRLLIHLGFAVLVLTPYVRILASLFYFAYVERAWKHAVLTASVCLLLSYVLFFG